MTLMFPSIKYNKKIYINPVSKRITLEQIKEEYLNKTINRIDTFQMKGNVKLEMLNEDVYYTDLFKKQTDKIVIRILCSAPLFRPDINDRDDTLSEQQQEYNDTF